jgi:hypothetical protein
MSALGEEEDDSDMRSGRKSHTSGSESATIRRISTRELTAQELYGLEMYDLERNIRAGDKEREGEQTAAGSHQEAPE